MATRTLLEVFSRYLPDGENRRFMEHAFLFGNMRVDKICVWLNWILPVIR